MIKYFFLPILFFIAVNSACGQEVSDSAKTNTGLLNETMLHPGDAFTAYTLKKGELSVNKAVDLLPIPNWIYWGITDWMTIETDIEANLGGVPSVNLRFALAKQKRMKPALAFESMYQYISDQFDLLLRDTALNVIREKNHTFNHLNASWKITDYWRLHLSVGVTYTQYLQLADTFSGNRKDYFDLISPDFSASIDWRAKNWLSLHATASYGSTFAYLDNVARKQQFVLATRIAPFVNNKHGFLRSFRMEFAIISFFFNDTGKRTTGPTGFIYWQWIMHNKKKKIN